MEEKNETTNVMVLPPPPQQNTQVMLRRELTVDDIVKQLEKVEELQKRVMKEGIDYGTIPGCGDKKILKKPGAEKLAMAFNLRAEFNTTVKDLPDGYKEFTSTCFLFSRITGELMGQATAICSTQESKFKYRGQATEDTGKLVPQEYWKIWKSEKPADIQRAKMMLGGEGFGRKKIGSEWKIVRFLGEKTLNENITDSDNTALRISEKRSFVASNRLVLAVSGLYDEEIDDSPDEQQGHIGNKTDSPLPSQSENQKPERPDLPPSPSEFKLNKTEVPKYATKQQYEKMMNLAIQVDKFAGQEVEPNNRFHSLKAEFKAKKYTAETIPIKEVENNMAELVADANHFMREKSKVEKKKEPVDTFDLDPNAINEEEEINQMLDKK